MDKRRDRTGHELLNVDPRWGDHKYLIHGLAKYLYAAFFHKKWFRN